MIEVKIRRNWWFWGLVFLFFVSIWYWRASTVMYYKAAPIYEGVPLAPEKSDPKFYPMAPPPLVITPTEPADPWGWVVKIGGLLAGFKTLLDIIDKFRKKTKLAEG